MELNLIEDVYKRQSTEISTSEACARVEFSATSKIFNEISVIIMFYSYFARMPSISSTDSRP